MKAIPTLAPIIQKTGDKSPTNFQTYKPTKITTLSNKYVRITLTVDPINVTNFTYATEHLKNDFWGVGPSFGIDSAWKIYTTNNSNFNIFANFSGALLWGHWSFSDVYQNNAPVAVTVLSKDIIGAWVRPEPEIKIILTNDNRWSTFLLSGRSEKLYSWSGVNLAWAKFTQFSPKRELAS